MTTEPLTTGLQERLSDHRFRSGAYWVLSQLALCYPYCILSQRPSRCPMPLLVPLLEFNHYRSIMVPSLPSPAHSPEKRITDGYFVQISEACRTSGGVEKWNSKVPS